MADIEGWLPLFLATQTLLIRRHRYSCRHADIDYRLTLHYTDIGYAPLL